MYRSLALTLFRPAQGMPWLRMTRNVAALALAWSSHSTWAMERVDALTLDVDAHYSRSVFTSGDGHWAWVVAESADPPNELVKVDLATLDEVDVVDFAAPGDWAAGPISAIDPFGSFIYVTYTTNDTFHTVIAKINTGSMQRVTDGLIDYTPTSLVVDALGDYAYIGSDEGVVEKIDLASMQVVDSLDTGASFLRSAAIDHIGNDLYFGTDTIPGSVVKIDLASFQLAGILSFTNGESAFRSIVIDSNGAAAYLGTGLQYPAQVAKVDLASFQPAGTLSFDSNVLGLFSAAIDSSGAYAYFGSETAPPRLLRIDLASYQLTDTLMLDETDGAIMSLAASSDGGQVYAGTQDIPGKLVKVAVQAPAPNVLRFDPEYLDFNDVELGTTQTRTATLENDGTNPATALSFATSLPDGMSVDTSACGASLAVGANCEVQLTYVPKVEATLASEWRASAAEGATGHITLLGRAVPVQIGAAISPAVLDFGGVDLGSNSAPQSFTLTNNSDSSWPVVTFTPQGNRPQDFDVDATACDDLGPGESCDVEVVFHPWGVAPDSVSLDLFGTAANAQIALSGFGVQSADSVLLDTTSIDFGTVGVGESATSTITLHNYGYDIAADIDFMPSDPEFTVDSSLCVLIAPRSLCEADVTFTPTQVGSVTGELTITTGQGLSLSLPMSGNATTGGTNALLVFDRSEVDFGPVGINTLADPQTVVLSNQGTDPASISSVQLTPPFEADGTDCVTQLGPSESCTIRISFTPISVGKYLAQLTVIYEQGTTSPVLVSGEGSTDAIFQGGFD